MGDVQQNITNTVEIARVTCPSCGTSGIITLYPCNSCRTQICDACRGQGYNCQNCIRESIRKKTIASHKARVADDERKSIERISNLKKFIPFQTVTLLIGVGCFYWLTNWLSKQNLYEQPDRAVFFLVYEVCKLPCGLLLIINLWLLISSIISLKNSAKLELR